jgi:Protein of unknown function (DUF2924)
MPKHLLYRILAYRLQADRLGDLDRDTQRFLDQVAAGTRNANEIPTAANQASRHGHAPGTTLVREWNGKPQRVMVLEEGFAKRMLYVAGGGTLLRIPMLTRGFQGRAK